MQFRSFILLFLMGLSVTGCGLNPFDSSPKTGTVKGTVVNAADRSVIASGAQITTNPPTVVVTTDSTTGAFVLSEVKPLDTFTIYISASGFDADSVMVSVTAGDTTLADIALQPSIFPSSAISGTVRRRDNGDPIVNAIVQTNPPTSSVTTDGSGAYMIAKVDPGIYTLLISAAGFDADSVSVSVTEGDTTPASIDLQLSVLPPRMISGKVIDLSTGSGIDNALIRTEPPTTAVTTESDGTYSISQVVPGVYTLFITASGFEADSIGVAVSASADAVANIGLKPSLLPSSTILGVVIDQADGAPVKNALVRTEPATTSVTTDSMGKYEIANINPGVYTLLVSVSGYDPDSVGVSVGPQATATANIGLSPSPPTAGAISGAISEKEAPSQKVSGALVWTDPPTVQLTTGSDGTYTISNVLPDTYTIMVSAPGFEPDSAKVVVVAGATSNGNIDLVKPAPTTGTIFGTVIDPAENTALKDVQISTNPPTSAVVTKADGTYTLSNIAPNTYFIVASASGYVTDTLAVSVVAGDTTSGNISLLQAVSVADTSSSSQQTTTTVVINGTVLENDLLLPDTPVAIDTTAFQLSDSTAVVQVAGNGPDFSITASVGQQLTITLTVAEYMQKTLTLTISLDGQTLTIDSEAAPQKYDTGDDLSVGSDTLILLLDSS